MGFHGPRAGGGLVEPRPAPMMGSMIAQDLDALSKDEPESHGFSRDRLRWLVRLRWVAMSGVLLVSLTTLAGVVEGPSVGVLLGVVLIGSLANLWLDRAARRGPEPSRVAPLSHAALALALLPTVLWATGGISTPFIGFYLFHVVLMATLGGPRSTVLSALLALGFVGVLAALDASPLTRISTWDPPPLIDVATRALGFVTLLGGITYLVAHAAKELRDRERALSRAREHRAHEERRLLVAERLASLGRVSQGVAHELNTPLATIRTLSADMLEAIAALREGRTSLEEVVVDLDESASIIRDETQRMGRVTQSLLKGGDLVDLRVRDDVPLREVVERARALVLAGRRSRATVIIDPSVWPVSLETDPDRLLQVLVNLVQNAVDAVREDGSEVVVRAEQRGDALEIRVEDDGPGLHPEMDGRLFEPFATTKPPGEGTGLGLYASNMLVETLGGRLELERHPTRGTVARVSLPQVAPVAHEEHRSSS
jgi:two-component system, sensor histidine kinase RegB